MSLNCTACSSDHTNALKKKKGCQYCTSKQKWGHGDPNKDGAQPPLHPSSFIKQTKTKCWQVQTPILVRQVLPSSSLTQIQTLRVRQCPRKNTSTSLPPPLPSSYKLRFSAFLSMARSWENLHLSPLVHAPCLKNAHSTDLGSTPVQEEKKDQRTDTTISIILCLYVCAYVFLCVCMCTCACMCC